MDRELKQVTQQFTEWEQTLQLPMQETALEVEWITNFTNLTIECRHRDELFNILKDSMKLKLIHKNIEAVKEGLKQRAHEYVYRTQVVEFGRLQDDVPALLRQIEHTAAKGTADLTDYAQQYLSVLPPILGIPELISGFHGQIIQLAKTMYPEEYAVVEMVLDSSIHQYSTALNLVYSTHLTYKEGYLRVEALREQFKQTLNANCLEICGTPLPEVLLKQWVSDSDDQVKHHWQNTCSLALEHLDQQFSQYVVQALHDLRTERLQLFDASKLSYSTRKHLASLLYSSNKSQVASSFVLMDVFFELLQLSDADAEEILRRNDSVAAEQIAEEWLRETDTEARFFCLTCVTLVLSGTFVILLPKYQRGPIVYEAWRRQWLRNWLHLAFESKYETHLAFTLTRNEFQWVLTAEKDIYQLLQARFLEWFVDLEANAQPVARAPPSTGWAGFIHKALNFSERPLDSVLRLEKLNEPRSLHVTIGVSGWLSQEDEFLHYWDPLLQMPGQGRVYALRWFSGSVANYLTKALPKRIATAAASFTNVKSAILWTAKLAQSNYFSEATQKAQETGISLAHMLEKGEFGGACVSLIGFSLGTRVIYHCLLELARLNSSRVHDVVLMGGATGASDLDSWKQCRNVVAGRFINVYSKKDAVLSTIYRLSQLQEPIGIRKLKVKGVENYNVTDLVSGHMAYHDKMTEVLQRVKLYL